MADENTQAQTTTVQSEPSLSELLNKATTEEVHTLPTLSLLLTGLHNRIQDLNPEKWMEAIKDFIVSELSKAEQKLAEPINALRKRVAQLEGRGSSAQLTPAPTPPPANPVNTEQPSNAPPSASVGGSPTKAPAPTPVDEQVKAPGAA